MVRISITSETGRKNNKNKEASPGDTLPELISCSEEEPESDVTEQTKK
jgi:hypothetical protein